jgi:hypothetical protein
MTDALFDLPKSQPKKRKPFVRTQRYTCKRCKGSSHVTTCLYCHKFNLVMNYGSGERDGKMFTANGDERVVCDGVRCRVG